LIGTIAIIEDDDALRDSARALLESYDYGVQEHSSGEDYLQCRGEADCLLVDHHMPGLTGLDLLELLRKGGDLTPALILTGTNDSTVAPRAKRIGVKLLRKPVTSGHLVRSIENALRTGAKKSA
jgi:FixJ family two-component response regulator